MHNIERAVRLALFYNTRDVNLTGSYIAHKLATVLILEVTVL